MYLKNFAIFFTSVLIVQACRYRESKVVSFKYGGYDTTCAILNGEVYEPDHIPAVKDSLQALHGVTIKARDSLTGKIYGTSVTNACGQFSINFCRNGIFNLTATKPGYQAAKITNYIADTGQVSTVVIILEKDNKLFSH